MEPTSSPLQRGEEGSGNYALNISEVNSKLSIYLPKSPYKMTIQVAQVPVTGDGQTSSRTNVLRTTQIAARSFFSPFSTDKLRFRFSQNT